MLLALKIDVDTLRGTREGAPNLVVLRRHEAGATFVCHVGPDLTGRALRRVFRPRIPAGCAATTVGTSAPLLYGTLLPARTSAGVRRVMRRCATTDSKTGSTRGTVRWQDARRGGRRMDAREMTPRAIASPRSSASRPVVHAAAGWQMSRHALR